MRKATEQIHVKLPKPLHKALKVRAAQDETTISVLVVQALERLLNPRKEA